MMTGWLKKSKTLKRLWRAYQRTRKDWFLHRNLPAIYRRSVKEPVDPKLVIFVERRYDSIHDSLELLYRQVKGGFDYTVHTHCLNQDFSSERAYRQKCRKLVKDLARASYVFISDANEVVSCVPMRPETVVTQTWHACGAFKRFGISTGEYLFGESVEEQRRYPKYKNLSMVTVSSPEVVWAYEEAMDLQDSPGVVTPVGVSRTDIFFIQEKIQAAYRKLYQVFGQANGKKVILYAPTYRGWASRAQAPDRLDYEMFARELGETYVMVVKQHPLVKEPTRITGEKASAFAFDATGLLSIEELLMVSDICISDYSSVVFEYSLFERPMLFFAYDLENYDDWRGFYYHYDEMTPGPVCKTNEEMVEWIRDLDHNFDREQVRAFKEKFMSACDGHATRRILEKTFGRDQLAVHRISPADTEGKRNR